MADVDDGLSMELDAMYPAAQPVAAPTGWHGRRLLTFGASEVPALLIALGILPRLAAVPLLLTMAVAIATVHYKAFDAQKGGILTLLARSGDIDRCSSFMPLTPSIRA